MLAWGYETIFHLMEAPTTRLPNVKVLLCWPSRMQILEQFDGTIEWKATEQSEGASPSDEAKQGAPPATERSEGASYALKPY